MACSDEELGATRAQFLLTAVGQQLGLSAAYHAFGRAAEFEDRADLLRSAMWQVVGRTIVVALCLPPPAAPPAVDDPGDALYHLEGNETQAADLQQRTRRIANSLGILLDAGRKGGSISSATVYSIARDLGHEIGALVSALDRPQPPRTSPPPTAPNQ